jgi:ATP-binding cassette subfamily B (MDR/TAP) protein 1
MIVYAGIAAFSLIFIYVNCWTLFSHRLAQRLRERYFQKLLSKDPSFFDSNHAGMVSSRLNGDIQAIQSGTCEKVGVVAASTSFFITAFTIAFIKQPRLAGMLASALPAFLLSAAVGGAFIQKYSSRVSEAVAAASSIASEVLNSISLVQVLGAGPRLESKFATHMSVAYGAGIKKASVAAVQQGMLYFIAYSANALAFWQGSREIARKAANPGSGSSIGEIYTVVFIITEGRRVNISPPKWIGAKSYQQHAYFLAPSGQCCHSSAVLLPPFSG